MKAQNQVCTLEQAKKLSELGVEQNCYNWYYEYKINGKTDTGFNYVPSMHELLNEWAAFNVAELGIMMQGISIMPAWSRDWDKSKTDFSYITCTGPNEVLVNAPTEAQARAQLLIFLIENDRFDLKEVNERLLAS